jgi:hypothetical protein
MKKYLFHSASILLLLSATSDSYAGFFSKGSPKKPVEIDEKQKTLVKFKLWNSGLVDQYGSKMFNLQIHNDSEWNICEVKIKVKVGEETRSYVFESYTVHYDKIVDGKVVNPEESRVWIPKNRTEVFTAYTGDFINGKFTYSIESIKGFED